MKPKSTPWITLLVLAVLSNSSLATEAPTMASVLAASSPADWRSLDPNSTLYLELGKGRVVIELATDFAPLHVENIRKLATAKYFDGLAIIRSQDNYVVQWGDPNAGSTDRARPLTPASGRVSGEYFRPADNLSYEPLESADAYASEVGFSNGFPAGRDGPTGRAWLAHCYGMVGAGRDVAPDSGSGAELYVVIGHAPRHLDRNVTLVGRVVQGMSLLSTLPRGTGDLGFYESPQEHTPIVSMRMANEVPEAERTQLELLRTDTETFRQLVQARRHRGESWFVDPADHIGLCNVPLPVRVPEYNQ